MAIGSQGQYTIVVPSHDLVIVKLGWAYTPHDDHVAVERLVRETIAALQSEFSRRTRPTTLWLSRISPGISDFDFNQMTLQ